MKCASPNPIIDIFNGLVTQGKIFFVILPSAKVGYTVEMRKFFWHFARLAVPLQIVAKKLIDNDTIHDRIWQGGKSL